MEISTKPHYGQAHRPWFLREPLASFGLLCQSPRLILTMHASSEPFVTGLRSLPPLHTSAPQTPSSLFSSPSTPALRQSALSRVDSVRTSSRTVPPSALLQLLSGFPLNLEENPRAPPSPGAASTRVRAPPSGSHPASCILPLPRATPLHPAPPTRHAPASCPSHTPRPCILSLPRATVLLRSVSLAALSTAPMAELGS